MYARHGTAIQHKGQENGERNESYSATHECGLTLRMSATSVHASTEHLILHACARCESNVVPTTNVVRLHAPNEG
jgi:hypothetical protein